MQGNTMVVQLVILVLLDSLRYILDFYFMLYKPNTMLHNLKIPVKKLWFASIPFFLIMVTSSAIFVFYPSSSFISLCLCAAIYIILVKYLYDYSVSRSIFWLGHFFLYSILIDIMISIPIILMDVLWGNTNILIATVMVLVLTNVFIILISKWIVRISLFYLQLTQLDYLMYFPLAIMGVLMSGIITLSRALLSDAPLWLIGPLALFYFLFVFYIMAQQFSALKKALQADEAKSAVTMTKPIVAEYLTHRHDIKNLLSALNYSHGKSQNEEESSFYQHYPLLNAMLRLKTESLGVIGIQINIQNHDFHLDVSRSESFEMNMTTILGILIDNARDHLAAHPTLNPLIQLSIGGPDCLISIGNFIADDGVQFLKSNIKKGFSTKVDHLHSGFGLSNAQTLAGQIGGKMLHHIEGQQIHFELLSK